MKVLYLSDIVFQKFERIFVDRMDMVSPLIFQMICNYNSLKKSLDVGVRRPSALLRAVNYYCIQAILRLRFKTESSSTFNPTDEIK